MLPRISCRIVLIAVLMQGVTAFSAESPDFHFTNDAFLEQSSPIAAMEHWTERCVSGGEFAEFAAAWAPDTQMSSAERRTQAAKFDRDEAIRIATAAWQKATVVLPQGPLRICIDLARVADNFTRDLMGGVAAVTAGRGRIILRIHPEADWKAALPYALAHEMHHSYWAQYHFDAKAPFTLADYLAFEGRADYFAATLFEHPAPWTTALDADTYAAVWRAVSKDLNSTDWEKLQGTMFGSPQSGIPRWAGYSIGFRLVSDRMAREPKLDLKAMTAAPASAFMPSPGR
jgi:hypothetical protein